MRQKYLLLLLLIAITLFCQIDLPPESRDYKLFWGDQNVGYYTYVLKPITGGWELDGETFMAVVAGGRPGRLRMLTKWELDSRMRPEYYEIAIYSNEELRQKIRIEISEQTARITEDEATRSIGFPPNAFIAELNVLDGWIILPRLFDVNVDSSFKLPMFVPQMSRMMEVEIFPAQFEGTGGAPSRKFLVSTSAFDVEFYAQTNSRTLTYWSSPTQGLAARLASKINKAEIESTLTGPDLLGTIMTQDNIISDINIEIPLRLTELLAEVDIRLAAGTEEYLNTAYQEADGEIENGRFQGKIEVEAEGYDGSKVLNYPIGPAKIEFRNEILPAPKIESDDSSITTLAVRLAGNKQNVWEVVKSINRHVADTIEINTEDHGALRTLNLTSGSGLSHARLCVALLRSIGIPARVVGGLLLDQGFWLRHHWVEVWTGEKYEWIPFDPTTGEDESFSAAHITLWRGEGNIAASETNSVSVLEYELRQ